MDLFEDLIFKNDPIYMKNLVGKLVKINTIEKTSYTGKLYVIDPIYKTVILHCKPTDSEENPQVVIVFHHAIESFEVISHEVDETYLEQKETQEVDCDVNLEKSKLRKWLGQMFIQAEEVGDYLKIEDHLVIMPPYGVNNCICNNTIILEKIRNIISSMPADFK
ncbi:uncharacterized protein LOC115876284 [Sitophilus oryzae]|uniref:Uncharacterized protein LOC115876284 n=1 Tax=Sitophilus oryzae TaxID=7048 RepID=A0A6J2X9G9_SITOR|nr:uncharacterized protein LOC115876284 [Sitophilus oryzae]